MTERPQRTDLPALLALAILAAPVACRDAPRSPEAEPPDTAPPATASLPPARYVTLVPWTARGGGPAGLLWLENATDDDGGLVRRYRGWWVDGDSVRAVLAVDDSLPVAAAAWRPLPAPGLRLSVDTRGRLSSLTVGEREGESEEGRGIRLRLGRELATWRGATGTDQQLRRGRLLTSGGDTAELDVTAAVLRFERLPGDPGPAGPTRTLLLSGEDGRGLLVLDEEAERPWSRGWVWDPDGTLTPLDAAALPDTAEGEGAWTFRPPGPAGAEAEWSVPGGDSLPVPAAEGASAAFRLLPVSARTGAGAEPGRGAARGLLLLAP